jgi:hypothetical protein
MQAEMAHYQGSFRRYTNGEAIMMKHLTTTADGYQAFEIQVHGKGYIAGCFYNPEEKQEVKIQGKWGMYFIKPRLNAWTFMIEDVAWAEQQLKDLSRHFGTKILALCNCEDGIFFHIPGGWTPWEGKGHIEREHSELGEDVMNLVGRLKS